MVNQSLTSQTHWLIDQSRNLFQIMTKILHFPHFPTWICFLNQNLDLLTKSAIMYVSFVFNITYLDVLWTQNVIAIQNLFWKVLAQYWCSAANASANTSEVLKRLCDSHCTNVIIWLARMPYTRVETLKTNTQTRCTNTTTTLIHN